jgi:hypothetical protein
VTVDILSPSAVGASYGSLSGLTLTAYFPVMDYLLLSVFIWGA